MEQSKTVMAVGMAWYRPETYKRLLTIFDDGDKLPDTFNEWEQKANTLKGSIEADGNIVIKVDIDPDSFPKWCIDNGHNIDAKGRTGYSALMAKNAIENS